MSAVRRFQLAWIAPAFLGSPGVYAVALFSVAMSASCSMSPPAAPVPLQGTQEDVKALSGEWAGRYWSKGTGRQP